MNERLSMARDAYITSEVAAPIPATKPDLGPLLNVLWMQNKPPGPRGTETEKPAIIPINKFRGKSFMARKVIKNQLFNNNL